MAHAMYKNYGCGIAAPQVGVTKRLVVIDVDWDGEKGGEEPHRAREPRDRGIGPAEPEEGGEGCLSCPGVTVPVKRQPWARVQYYDLDGELWEIEGDGLLGRCLQHEIDPLERQDALRELRSGDPHRGATRLRGGQGRRRPPGDTDIEVK